MADVTLVNVAASQILPRGSVLRITFAERYSWQVDAGFAQRYRDDVFANIAGTHLLYPIVADGAIDGLSVATTDCRMSTDAALSSVLAALNDLSSWFVTVQKVELLTPALATQAPTADGATQRGQTATEEQQTRDASDPWHAVLGELNLTLSAGKWLAIAALVGAAFFVIPGLLPALRAMGKRVTKK